MTAYLWFAFVLCVIGILGTVGHLTGEYPRTEKHGVGYDCAKLILGVAILGWLSYLLFVVQP